MKKIGNILVVVGLALLLSSCASVRDQDGQLDMKVAQAAERSNHPEIAVKNYESVLAENPRDAKVQQKLVILYQRLKENQKALALLKKMLKEGDNAFASYYYARVTEDMGLPNIAIEHYLELNESAEYQAKSLNNLAVILAKEGKNNIAQKCFYTGLKRYPENTSLRYNAALSLALNPGDDLSLAHKMRSLLKNSESVEIRKLLEFKNQDTKSKREDTEGSKQSSSNIKIDANLLKSIQQLCDSEKV